MKTERMNATPHPGPLPIRSADSANAERGKRVRVVECTQANFEKLPALVSRQEFLNWTGYDKNELAEEVKAGRIQTYKPKGHVKAKYYKFEIGRLGRWKT